MTAAAYTHIVLWGSQRGEATARGPRARQRTLAEFGRWVARHPERLQWVRRSPDGAVIALHDPQAARV